MLKKRIRMLADVGARYKKGTTHVVLPKFANALINTQRAEFIENVTETSSKAKKSITPASPVKESEKKQ